MRPMKYRIEVHALGYDDTSLVVEAPSLREAKRSERDAKLQWCEHNDIDTDSVDLAFTRITKL